MTWTVEWDDRARRELRRLDRQIQRDVTVVMGVQNANHDGPRCFGKPLRHELQGLGRYRIGSYRAICQIENDQLVVFVLAVGHRRRIYR